MIRLAWDYGDTSGKIGMPFPHVLLLGVFLLVSSLTYSRYATGKPFVFGGIFGEALQSRRSSFCVHLFTILSWLYLQVVCPWMNSAARYNNLAEGRDPYNSQMTKTSQKDHEKVWDRTVHLGIQLLCSVMQLKVTSGIRSWCHGAKGEEEMRKSHPVAFLLTV